MNKKLTITFVGTKFCGWAKQKNGISVCGTLQKAIESVVGEKITLLGCSRTDSGVHARRYVCSFKTKTAIPNEKLVLAVNHYLDEDIRVLKCEDAEDDFNPAFCAKKKTYIYQIYESKVLDPFLRPYVWHVPASLDFESMKKACGPFLWCHDFAAFCATGGSAKTTTRTIYELDLAKEGDLIKIKVTADGFLYNMVRIIAGTLYYVGLGKIKPEEITDIINSGDRSRSGPTAPPCGLFLYEVYY